MLKRVIATFCLVLIAPLCLAHEALLDETPMPQDQASLLRGAETTLLVCGGCHGLKYVRFSHLLSLGFPKDKLDELRGSQPLDAPVSSAMPDEAAKAAFGGATPPDLSLMANAREGRAHYLYSYLIGFQTDAEGNTHNRIFKETRMPDVLGIGAAVSEADKARIRQQAQEVTAFLTWAADPHALEREQLGKYVLGYLFVLTLLLWLWKKQIWRKLDEEPAI